MNFRRWSCWAETLTPSVTEATSHHVWRKPKRPIRFSLFLPKEDRNSTPNRWAAWFVPQVLCAEAITE